MSTALTVFICGKIPSHLAAVPKALTPEYDGEYSLSSSLREVSIFTLGVSVNC